MLEDRLLIWKFKRGSSDALRRIYEKHKDDLLRLAVVLSKDINTAEDVVQDVFVSFAQSAEKMKLEGNLKGYLSTSVINRIKNKYRDRHQTGEAYDYDSIDSQIQSPDQWIIFNEKLQILSKAISQLPFEQQEVITLYHYGDMKFQQIAKLQESSVHTIQSRYRYGMEKLKTLLNSKVKS